jgi:hypothetical protein
LFLPNTKSKNKFDNCESMLHYYRYKEMKIGKL